MNQRGINVIAISSVVLLTKNKKNARISVMVEKTMDKIVALAKSRGFVYPGSEIYGGLANTWDYGNLGVELKNNVKRAWWKKFIQENPYNVGVDCAILMNPQTWIASGHLGGFSDPLMILNASAEKGSSSEECLTTSLPSSSTP